MTGAARRPGVCFALAAAAAGLLLQAYTMFVVADSVGLFNAALFVLGCLPYCVAVGLACRLRAGAAPGAAFAAGTLAGDVTVHVGVFVHPTSSTAAVGFVGQPLANLLIVGPGCALLACALVRAARAVRAG